MSASSSNGVARHVRGSSLLLAGRLISLGINLLVQVLTVRYLARSEYGSFAYGMAIAGMGASFAVFGLEKAAARFVAIYQERGDTPRMAGAALLSSGLAGLLGVLIAALALLLAPAAGSRWVSDPLSLELATILILLAPIQALEAVLQGLLAIFAGPRAVFVRRHLAGPGLRLAAVLGVMAAGAGVRALAYATLAAGLVGLLLYVSMLARSIRAAGLAPAFRPRAVVWPVGELLRFTLPTGFSSVNLVVHSLLVVALIEALRGPSEVAGYRAVVPVAGLNLVAYQSFLLLYTPEAARAHARGDVRAAGQLYWSSAVWIAMATFPVALCTTVLARPLTELFFGARYADAAGLLGLLSAGNIAVVMLGFSGPTLRVQGRTTITLAVDLVGAAIGLGLCYLWIPAHGALGGAAASVGMLVLQKLLTLLVLHQGGGVGPPGRAALGAFASLVAILVAVSVACAELELKLPLRLLLVGAGALLGLALNHRALAVAETFPELARVPLLGRWLAGRARR